MNDELDEATLQQMIQAGLIPQQNAALQSQLAQIQQFSQPSGRQYSTVAGNILGGAGDILRQLVGGYQQGKIQTQMSDNLKKGADARGLMLKQILTGNGPPPAPPAMAPTQSAKAPAPGFRGLAAPGAPPGNIPGGVNAPSLFDDPTPGEMARATADALRNHGRATAMAGILSGDPSMAELGRMQLAQMGRADERQQEHQWDLDKQKTHLAGQKDLAALGHANDMERTKYSAGEEWKRLQAQLGAAKEKAKAEGDAAALKRIADAEEGLRKELMGNPVTKATQEVATAYDRVKYAVSNPSPAGDVALIYGMMKMMDPGSTVREGETATAEQARGIPSQLLGFYNKAVSGQRLDPGVRQDFLNQAAGLHGAAMKRYGALESSYQGLARGSGVDPSRVAIPLGFSDTGGVADPRDSAALEWAKSHPNDPRAAAILKLHGGKP